MNVSVTIFVNTITLVLGKLTMRYNFNVSGGQHHSLHIILDHQQITNMLIVFPLNTALYSLYRKNPSNI